jgi:hypothetical protein
MKNAQNIFLSMLKAEFLMRSSAFRENFTINLGREELMNGWRG